jgi:flagellar hook-associated protein 2
MSYVIKMKGGGQFSLAAMGIRYATDVSEGAILTINEGDLTAALENNIEAVTALFTGSGAVGGASQGLGARLDGELNRYVSHIVTTSDRSRFGALDRRAGVVGSGLESQSTLSRQMAEHDRRINTMMTWLERRETQLFAQFSRMEQAMMQGQQQMMFWDQIMWGAM